MGLQIKYFNFLFFTGFQRILLQKKILHFNECDRNVENLLDWAA